MLSLVSIDYVNIGKQLQTRRQTLGITQEQLAQQLSISTTQLSRIECGQRPSLQTILQLAALLNLSLDGLFNVCLSADRTLMSIHKCLLELNDEQRRHLLTFLNCLTDN